MNGSDAIAFEVSSRSPQLLDVRVYDVFGRLIRVLENGTMISGMRFVTWDGATDRGTPAPSGVYFVDVRAGTLHKTERTLLMR